MVAFNSLSRVYWYDSTIGLTLDTVSVLVNQYNNTAITTSSIIHGNAGAVNASTVSETKSLAAYLQEQFFNGNLQYGSTAIAIGNATQGIVDGSVTIPYPTPYLAIDGFQYVSVTDRVHGCPPGHLKGSGDVCTCIMDTLVFALAGQHVGYPLQGWGPGGEVYPEQHSVMVSLTSTYYETLTLETISLSNLVGVMNSDAGIVNTASFLEFLSAASVFKSYPALSSCKIYSRFNGPPKVMIPASALTATARTTLTNAGPYGVPTAIPGSPVKSTAVPQTAGANPSTPTIPAAQVPETETPAMGTPTEVPELPKGPDVPSLSSPGAPKNPPDLPGVQPIADFSTTAGEQVTRAQGTFTPSPGEPKPVQPAPVLTFDGSTYQANQASHFVIAGQTVTPGGAIVTSGTPIAIDSNALTAVIGTSTQPLSNAGVTPKPLIVFAGTTYTADASTHFVIDGNTLTKGGTIDVDKSLLSFDKAGAAVVIGTSTQSVSFVAITAAPEPILMFHGSAYTADSSSNFIIDGQTLVKGSAITVGGTQISYDEVGTGVVIGTRTPNLHFAAITAAPEPILTFDGSTYTADYSSNFVIGSQTLVKGGKITIDGTQLSYDEAGTDAVIGTSTQMLRTTIVTAVPDPAITFDGSVYTADYSSNFVVAGQTLTKGGIITVQSTPISYAADGKDVVVGSSTEAVGLGGYIMSGFGGGPSATASVPVQLFAGSAARTYSAPWGFRFLVGAFVVYLGL